MSMSPIAISSRKRSVRESNQNLRHHRSSEPHNLIQKNVSMDSVSKGTVSFHNISYTVGGRQENSPWRNWQPSFMKPKRKTTIVDDISGVFIPGMNAIMGKSHTFC